MTTSAQTWKCDICCPRYKTTLVCHSLTISTLTTIRCILELDLYSLTRSSTFGGFASRCHSSLQILEKVTTLL